MIKTKKTVKTGHLVFAKYNECWGLLPMRVVSVDDYGFINAKHPELGIGGFCDDEYVAHTPAREAVRAGLQALNDAYNCAVARVFRPKVPAKNRKKKNTRHKSK